MTLSIVSNAASYGRPLGYGLAGLTPRATDAGAAQRSGAAASWTYTPPSAGAGRRDAHLSDLMAVLSRLSASPAATATVRVDDSGSASGSPARGDAADLLPAPKDTGGAPALAVLPSPERSSPELDRQHVQDLAQRPATDIMPAQEVGLPTQDAPADPSISTAEAQLQALFKTLQAYGL